MSHLNMNGPLFGNKPMNLNNQIKVNKGLFNGSCNRSACTNINASWFNHSTRMYYCTSCARMLNEANYSDAQRTFGHDLCTKGEHEE